MDEHLIVGERGDAGELLLVLTGSAEVADLERLDAFATFADDHARARRVHDDLGAVGSTLDLNARDRGVVEVLFDGALDAHILVQPLTVFRAGLIPFAAPRLDDAKAEAVRVGFLSHKSCLLLTVDG